MPSAEALTKALGGRWRGGSGLAFCPAHENHKTPALSLRDGAEGLLAYCFAGCGFAEVMAALKTRGLISGGARMMISHPEAERRRRLREAAEQADTARRSEWAAKLWAASQPIDGTQAEAYLWARGLVGPFPRILRHHPRLRHPSGAVAPALLARIDGGEGFAIHRTWLDPEGAPAKISAKPQKAMLGPAGGGVVRLRAGEAGGLLAVAEGIETTLALGRGLTPEDRLWAALSTSGMKGLRLPERAGSLLIGCDGDAPGREAGRALAHRATGLGWRVKLADPGDGRDFAGLAALDRTGATHG